MTDSLSLIMRLAAKACGGAHPLRFACAVCTAVFIQFIGKLGIVMYPGVTIFKIITEANLLEISAILIPVFFLSVLRGGKGAPEAAVQQVKTIELLIEKAGFSKPQKTMIWRALVDKYLQAAKPDLQIAPDLTSSFEEVRAERAEDSAG